ncbi:16765_t:CDS:1, partial [Dentiscutata heterogama]
LHEVLSDINFLDDDNYDKDPINEKRTVNERFSNDEDNSILLEEHVLKIEKLLNFNSTSFIDNLDEII